MDNNQLGLEEIIDRTLESTIYRIHKDPYLNAVQTAVNYRILEHLIALAATRNLNPQATAICHNSLRKLRATLVQKADNDSREMVLRIDNYFAEPSKFKAELAPKIPDGSPIGMECDY